MSEDPHDRASDEAGDEAGDDVRDEVLAALLAAPGVRPEAVARARTHLRKGPAPTAGEVAQAVLDHHREPATS